MVITQGQGFFEFNIGHVIELGVFIVAFATLYLDRKKTEKEQIEMYTENQQKLRALTEFHSEQKELNGKRDEQIGELKMQTALIQQSVELSERRLRLIENRCFRMHDKEKLDG